MNCLYAPAVLYLSALFVYQIKASIEYFFGISRLITSLDEIQEVLKEDGNDISHSTTNQ